MDGKAVLLVISQANAHDAAAVGLGEGLMAAEVSAGWVAAGWSPLPLYSPLTAAPLSRETRFTLLGPVTCWCVTGFPAPGPAVKLSASVVAPFTWKLEIPCWILDIDPLPSPVACLLTTYCCSPFSRIAVHICRACELAAGARIVNTHPANCHNRLREKWLW